ncbi:MAG TPA: AmmeMemoRadiSam system radical SAM enzyme [Desulfonatronum sp.]|nr:AmmeMemoRadiSam system radical SAM enzyme [Desulfonatronum sp.]
MESSQHEALLWKPLKDGKVQCRLCAHFCVIVPGERGLCGVRENRDGRLMTLVRDKVAALNLDPVEKKPLYHFFPGTKTLSLGTMGCNLSCTFCQNAGLSQSPRQGKAIRGDRISGAQIVALAQQAHAASISYTYSEPTIFFELVAETARLALKEGLRNIIVSNGFQSPECLEAWGELIHAANIDLKAFRERFYHEQCGARLKPVLENLKAIRGLGWWLEVTTLVIPGLNDDPAELRDMAGFIAQELGPDTPWHLSRFHPDHVLLDRPPTPQATLEMAWDIGKQAGLRYVYLGNIVSAHDGENTFCPDCGAVLLKRMGFAVRNVGLRDGDCSHCGKTLPGRGLEKIPGAGQQ